MQGTGTPHNHNGVVLNGGNSTVCGLVLNPSLRRDPSQFQRQPHRGKLHRDRCRRRGRRPRSGRHRDRHPHPARQRLSESGQAARQVEPRRGQEDGQRSRLRSRPQLRAARLNIVAGAGSCTAAVNAINDGQTLLASIRFNGITHDKLSSAQSTQANSLALDRYNNNLLC